MKKDKRLLRYACEEYQRQYNRGGLFLHEHPESATSWKEPCIQRISNLPGVITVVADLCQYGLKYTTARGVPL